MDCDNDHSDNADMWITTAMVDNYFPDVNYVVVPSRGVGSHYSDRLRFNTATDFIVYNDFYWEESKKWHKV